MKKYPNLSIAIGLVLLLALGSLLGRQMTHLRQSEAFYRWIVATATTQRLFHDTEDEFRDIELFQRLEEFAEHRLPEVPGADPQDSRLVAAAAELTTQKPVYDLAASRELAQERQAFLEYARNQELQFTTGITYAEAQASGVNIFNLFFGFRRLAANFIWLEVDRYWHMGMMYRMIPLMKTCVALDPHFVDAYLLGAWHMAYNATARMPDTPPALQRWNERHNVCMGEKEAFYYFGVDFLRDGIRNNPQEYRLYFDLGFAIYNNKLNDHENAVRYLREAVRVPHERWVPRMLYHAMESNQQYEEALAGWQDYQQRFPDTAGGEDTAPRFIQRNTALIYEQRAEEARAAARDAVDAAARQALLQEAAENEARAREIWEEMTLPPDDPHAPQEDAYAEARLLRMDAMHLVEQNRHREAIALLDQARWQSAGVWDEASDLIIEIKQQAGIPLSVSEQKAVLREIEREMTNCIGAPASLRADSAV